MPELLKQTACASEADRHLEQIGTLLFHNGVLLSGADDGKIKVRYTQKAGDNFEFSWVSKR